MARRIPWTAEISLQPDEGKKEDWTAEMWKAYSDKWNRRALEAAGYTVQETTEQGKRKGEKKIPQETRRD